MAVANSSELAERLAFFHEIPKIELHAHLNGSVRRKTIIELADERGLDHVSFSEDDLALREVFSLFALISKITTEHEAITRITKEVIQDFAADNVKYLELRTTPKENPSIKMTKRSYVEAVIAGIDNYFRSSNSPTPSHEQHSKFMLTATTIPATTTTATTNNMEEPSAAVCKSASGKTTSSHDSSTFKVLHDDVQQQQEEGKKVVAMEEEAAEEEEGEKVKTMEQKKCIRKKSTTSMVSESLPIFVRLILSINRTEDVKSAMETVQLAYEMRHQGVIGVDLCGDPSHGDWSTFESAFEWAKQHGMKVTLHCGEVPNYVEVNRMLAFRPDRIGHAVFFKNEQWDKLLKLKIPVEVCLTSNLLSQSVRSMENHHFGSLYTLGHPIILCTDDCGIFSTTLSKEYGIAASTFRLKDEEVVHMAENSIDYIFEGDSVKNILRNNFMEFKKGLKSTK